MAIQININGTNFSLPDQGQNAPWGDDLSDIIQAIVTTLNGVSGTADIPTSSFNLSNNISSAANITGLLFNTSQVRSAIVEYSVSRVTSSNEKSEQGQLFLTYNATNSAPTRWSLARMANETSGITFTITSAGQVQYTSTNLAGTGHVGKLKFKAKTFLQA